MSVHDVNRRAFLQTSLGALAGAHGFALPPQSFSFVLLGDLHFDKPEHHDWAWVKEHSPDSVRQSANYSKLTAEVMPKLFATIGSVIEAGKATTAPVRFVLQVGDLVEGLCGSDQLAETQNREALAFVEGARLGVPLLFTKGNHDVTGPASVEMYRRIFHPFLAAQAKALSGNDGAMGGSCLKTRVGNAEFCFFDAYDSASLDWLEAAAASRTAEHFFVVIHPPVVPYGARSTWHLYSGAKDQAKREKLLHLLGTQEAFVLGGHIHKYCELSRVTRGGRFAQLALSSVISPGEVRAKTVLTGVEQYTGDQVRVEPAHSPETEPQRRAVLEAERPSVRAFEYADLPGFAVVTVGAGIVQAEVYSGATEDRWRTVDLMALRTQAA